MTNTIYACDDYAFENNTLTIWNAKKIAKVKDLKGFSTILKLTNYTCTICPTLMDKTIDTIIFK